MAGIVYVGVGGGFRVGLGWFRMGPWVGLGLGCFRVGLVYSSGGLGGSLACLPPSLPACFPGGGKTIPSQGKKTPQVQ